MDLQDKNNKKCLRSFDAYSFLKAHLHPTSKIKGYDKSQNSRNQDFSSFFACFWKDPYL
jgi:hypothetical protein